MPTMNGAGIRGTADLFGGEIHGETERSEFLRGKAEKSAMLERKRTAVRRSAGTASVISAACRCGEGDQKSGLPPCAGEGLHRRRRAGPTMKETP